jgi:hypothetical protein
MNSCICGIPIGKGHRGGCPRVKTFTLTIPIATPSQNKFHYSHWTKARNSKQEIGYLILMAMKNSETQEKMKATGKRRLIVERFGRGKKLDYSNFVGGLKGTIDALVGFGLLVDDSDDWLELVAFQKQKPPKEECKTILTLEDI